MLSLFAVLSGLVLDSIYSGFGISASAIAGQAGEIIPYWLQFGGALIVILLSVKPVYLYFKRIIFSSKMVSSKIVTKGTNAENSPAENSKTESCAPS
jgi:hypothetical protein